ncbi:MAG TPA: sporulation protein YqfD [Desulfotomaculum sp.]|nr:sporulation protein YqfD [Desulfotomaculum sp.]
MFLFKLMNFLTGYVTIIVMGESPEKLINMAATRGIFLWDITRLGERALRARVRPGAVWPLRHMARRTGCRFRIQQRSGLPFLWMRLTRRRVLAAGALFFVAGLYFLSSFIWSIEVTGNRRLSTGEILQVASRAGLNRGVLRWRLDPPAVEEAIRTSLPGVSWTGVYIRGTRVTVEVVEKTLPEGKNLSPVHIVAGKAGLIKEVLVLNGHAAVKAGDTVVPGQVLISGVIPPPEEPPSGEKPSPGAPPETVKREPAFVHAAGIVRARVWYEGYGEAPLAETLQRPTGREFTRVCMKIGAREIMLAGSSPIPFPQYQSETRVKKLPAWRNLQLPVEVIINKYREMESYRLIRDRAEARRLAGERAMAVVQSRLPRGATVVHKQLDELVVRGTENLVRMKAMVESVEEIGVERPFTPGELQPSPSGRAESVPGGPSRTRPPGDRQ